MSGHSHKNIREGLVSDTATKILDDLQHQLVVAGSIIKRLKAENSALREDKVELEYGDLYRAKCELLEHLLSDASAQYRYMRMARESLEQALDEAEAREVELAAALAAERDRSAASVRSARRRSATERLRATLSGHPTTRTGEFRAMKRKTGEFGALKRASGDKFP